MASSKIYSAKVGLESAYGDGGATPTNVPFIWGVGIPEWKPEFIENEVSNGGLQRSAALVGKITSAIKGQFYAKGSGTAGTAPEWAKIIKICGFGETVVAVTSVTYSPINSSIPSATLTVNIDGREYALKGMRGDGFELELVAGQPAKMTASLVGLYTRPTASAFSAPSFADSATVHRPVTGMALTINGQTFIMPKFSLNCKNNIFIGDSINSSNGYGIQEIQIIGREYEGKFTVWRDTNNDTELEALMDQGTEFAFSSTGFGVSGNKVAVSGSKMQLTNVKEVAIGNGVAGFDCDFRLNYASTLANELSITLT